MATPPSASTTTTTTTPAASTAGDPPALTTSSARHVSPFINPSVAASLRSPLFSSQPLLGKPLNPPHSPAYPVARGYSPRAGGSVASGRPSVAVAAVGDQGVTMASPYVRGTSPSAVMTYAAAQPRGYVIPGEQPVHVIRPSSQVAPHFGPPRQARAPVAPSGPPKSTSLTASQPKVASFPSAAATLEHNVCNEREQNRDDSVVMIHGRKVRLLDGGSGSLYALCRSWVRNGLLQETQSNYGDGPRILPRPLPASVVKNYIGGAAKDDNEAEDLEEEEHVGSIEHISSKDLLKGHIKRAKRVRARLRKERLIRIERFKQRLALLLPVSNDMGTSDAAPKS